MNVYGNSFGIQDYILTLDKTDNSFNFIWILYGQSYRLLKHG